MSIPQSGGTVIERKEQLSEYLESGCKSKNEWRIGTEHEKFGYDLNTHFPIPYEGSCSVKSMLLGLHKEFGWEPLTEDGNIIGLTKNQANISLEPGGQLELSGAPLKNLHETCDEVSQHLEEVRTVAEHVGAGFMGIGAAPEWTHEQMPMMPKGRYRLMTDYMRKVGQCGVQMMYRTCTVQVNLDFSSEEDMVKKLRTALALQPIATAFFANSPFFEGKKLDVLSWRSTIWQDLDPNRTGMLPFVFNEGFGFEQWAEYALDVPMYFVFRNGQYLDARGLSFRDFLNGSLPILPGELPTTADWADHLTTIFPEARIKKFIEMRGADGGTWRRLCALPAFWVGLLYDQNSLDASWDLVKNLDCETRDKLRVAAAKDGLRGEANGISIRNMAGECLAIAEEGLKSRACYEENNTFVDECHFLNSLHETFQSGKTPADELLELYLNDWGEKLDPIYEECSY